MPLKVSGAFHTPYMQEATVALHECLNKLHVKSPSTLLISNTTATPYPDQEEEIIRLMARQASNSVRFEDTLRYMYSCGVDTFIEIGAGTTLSGLVRKTLSDVTILNVSDMESLNHTITTLQGKGE